MYTLKVEAAFDSAHFLHGYEGKCSNIHGHRWRICCEICGEKLCEEGQLRGMIVDFGDLKKDLRAIADSFDHSLIYEENTLKPATVNALADEGFRTVVIPCRPTAENFAKLICDKMTSLGYSVREVTVYETPDNCAKYIP